MLNISDNPIHINESQFSAFQKVALSRPHLLFRRWLLAVFGIMLLFLFLPWTQNIRAKGKITTLTPDQRPQTIHATIAGRIEQWYVQEGQLVHKGDTILRLSEIKTEYFDPNLLARTQEQVKAKSESILTYNSKAEALGKQIGATRQELLFKKEQLTNKIDQTRLKAEGEQTEIEAAKIDLQTEQLQLARTEELFKQGLQTRTALENKRLKLQQTQAKMTVTENKYAQTLQEIENLKAQLNGVESEYQGKIAKSESERFSTLSEKFDAEGSASKLQNQYSNYAARAQFYVITAPQDCYINRATAAGIGETVKEGEPVVSVLPAQMDLAVEMFVDPIDLPLIEIGSPVRFIFDGWPSIVFSGWPNASVGTYAGRVFAVDKVANDKGKFRVLVAPDPQTRAWPDALRPGSGANGIALLKDVPLWYELWRQLNGFPPEYYAGFEATNKEKK